jgi:NADPH-dependent 7-cyano-7-deazaguanine reductase QueF-like protein
LEDWSEGNACSDVKKEIKRLIESKELFIYLDDPKQNQFSEKDVLARNGKVVLSKCELDGHEQLKEYDKYI